jgi:hypothetical protein
LIEKSEILKEYKDKYFILFSKSGFTKELKDKAMNSSNIELVDLDKLFDIVQ